MSLFSFVFFVFLAVALLIYYCAVPAQRYVLLAASLFFYIQISSVEWYELLEFVLLLLAVVYAGARLLSKARNPKPVLFVTVTLLVGILFCSRFGGILSAVRGDLSAHPWTIRLTDIASLAGLPYYTLVAIGYVVDVYWGICPAEKNIGTVGVFIFYFPQLISGPVTRFSEMKGQFESVHRPDYDRMTCGMRRMLWGYFQKLVISERFALIVDQMYEHYGSYGGLELVAATLCFAVQLYTDFSGCMDIVLGTSELFGIRLPENFRAPFFSQTLQEFWRRWHISLGQWFKDYVMYPIQKSSLMVGIGKRARTVLGKKKGKKLQLYLSMISLWLLIGFWHGSAWYYLLASGIVPGMMLILSDVLDPAAKKLNAILHIQMDGIGMRVFRSVRTLLLICILWIFWCAGGAGTGFRIIGHMVTHPLIFHSISSLMQVLGLTGTDILLMAVGLVLLWFADYQIYHKSSIFQFLDQKKPFLRLLVVYAEFFTILIFGMVGTSSFIYFQL